MIEFWIVDGMSCVFLHTDQLLVENEFCKCPKSGTLVTFQLPLSQLLPGTNGEFRWSEGEQCYCISSSKSIRRANSVERVKWMYGKGEMKWSLVKIEDCRWGGYPIAGCKDWKTSTSASPLSSIRAASCRQYFFSCVLAFIYDRISSTCAYNLPEPPWTNHIFRHLEQLPWSIHPSVTFSDFYCVIAKLSGSQIKSWVALSLLVVRPSVPHPLHEHLCQYI